MDIHVFYALESKKRELIEDTLKKLDIGDDDLMELEKIRGEVWKKEKKKLRLRVHEPDCECGQCTGEDRALEAMEKGICKAERDYGDN